MSVIALTGGIGAGKSTVAQFFNELGAVVVDADQLARIAIERGSEGFDEVIKCKFVSERKLGFAHAAKKGGR